MSTKRSYEDACATAHALDLIGERWALLVARELMLGPKRFTDLRAGLPGISPNVLTQRLTELEDASIVYRHRLPPPTSAWVYELTAWGQELEVVIQTIGRWAARSPGLKRPVPMGVDSLVLSLRTMFSPAAAAGVSVRYNLRLGEHAFRLEVADGQLLAERGRLDAPDATITADPTLLAGFIHGGLPLDQALQAGGLRFEGERTAVERLPSLFTRPVTAPRA